jgi:hypothetical protein
LSCVKDNFFIIDTIIEEIIAEYIRDFVGTDMFKVEPLNPYPVLVGSDGLSALSQYSLV